MGWHAVCNEVISERLGNEYMKYTEYELEQMYEQMLDECYGVVKIAGLEYSTSLALKEIDPTTFRCGFNDWLDSELGETIFEINGEYYDNEEGVA